MNQDTAIGIAREAFYELMRNREELKGAYDFIAGEMDIEDKELEEAFETLFDQKLEPLE